MAGLSYYRGLQVGAIFEIFFISLLGFSLPYLYVMMFSVLSTAKKTINGTEKPSIDDIINSDMFRIGRSLSTGIILGVAVMHLLVDVSSVDLLGNGYPMTFAIVLLGIISLIGFEQLSIYAMTTYNAGGKTTKHHSSSSPTISHKEVASDGDVEMSIKQSSNNTGHDHGHDHGHDSHGNDHDDDHDCPCDDHDHDHDNSKEQHSDSHKKLNDVNENMTHFAHSHGHGHGDGGHIHAHSMDLILDRNINRSFIKAIIMELSIAVHSVIIGFDLGLLTSSDTITIQALMIAFAFHQFFEGISLGTVTIIAKFSIKAKLFLGLFFSVTLPVGIIIGMTTSVTATGDTIKTIANAFAAGSLLYNGMIEMAAEDFADPSLASRPLLKFFMIVAIFIGAACMALLAYWA